MTGITENSSIHTPPSPAARSTNGLAIASLVLSLVWLCGIGAVLAVIFGAVARRQIRRSNGTQSGAGLALAGLIVGVVGVVGAVVLWTVVIAFGNDVHNATTPRTITVAVGHSVDVDPSLNLVSDIRRVTVYSVAHPVPPPSTQGSLEAGKELAAADVEICAGPGGSQHGLLPIAFTLVFPGGQTAEQSLLRGRAPDLNDVNAMAANQCVRGFVTFVIATGTSPTALRYQPGPFRTYVWNL